VRIDTSLARERVSLPVHSQEHQSLPLSLNATCPPGASRSHQALRLCVIVPVVLTFPLLSHARLFAYCSTVGPFPLSRAVFFCVPPPSVSRPSFPSFFFHLIYLPFPHTLSPSQLRSVFLPGGQAHSTQPPFSTSPRLIALPTKIHSHGRNLITIVPI
jgi:hypothetical protein